MLASMQYASGLAVWCDEGDGVKELAVGFDGEVMVDLLGWLERGMWVWIVKDRCGMGRR